MSTFRQAVATAFFTLFLLTPVMADWIVTNDHEDEFIITYWSRSNPKTTWTKTIPPGKTLPLKLGMDKHMVVLFLKNGERRPFEALTLEGRKTDLSELVTRDKKSKDGYRYMNQKPWYQLKKGK